MVRLLCENHLTPLPPISRNRSLAAAANSSQSSHQTSLFRARACNSGPLGHKRWLKLNKVENFAKCFLLPRQSAEVSTIKTKVSGREEKYFLMFSYSLRGTNQTSVSFNSFMKRSQLEQRSDNPGWFAHHRFLSVNTD